MPGTGSSPGLHPNTAQAASSHATGQASCTQVSIQTRPLHAVHAGASAVLSRGSEWRSEDENDRVSLSLVSLDYDIMQYVFGKEHEYDVSGSGAVLPSGKDEVEDLFEMVHERVPFYFCSENDMLLDH